CGILFNAFLLYLIVRFSRPSLGTYKYLLFVFASYDIFISILTAFYCASYTVPFLLTIINFLYRFWAVRWLVAVRHCTILNLYFSPIRIRLFTNPFFVVLLILAMTGQEEEIAKDEAREEYRRRYHQTIIEGYVISDHW
ncbi:hypothetical protein PFISCL1PPCAC_13993, partial [Pristionchus fissidentatus]